MRSLAVLALFLGLAAVAYAQDASADVLEEPSLPPTSVLLAGLVADEDMFKGETNSSSALNGHYRHWHRRGPRHDPEDHHYWERRHSAKAELMKCIRYAEGIFDADRSSTWKRAGKTLAHCFLEHLGHCHDVPNLGDDITQSLPWLLAVRGLDALVANGDTGLLHASAVFGFYFAGAQAPTQTQPNPWYIAAPAGCASKLAALLHSGCNRADQSTIFALAKVVAKFIEAAATNPTSDLGLGACVADIPAVILSLFATDCPAQGYLFNALVPAGSATSRIPCKPATTSYQNSAAALLGGSIYTLFLLSGKTNLIGLGVQVAFAANRMALAATQTTSFADCIGIASATDTTFYDGKLNAILVKIPIWSGALGSPQGFRANTLLPLDGDGQRVICASIAMMSGDPDDTTFTYKWQANLMWQATADIANAIFSTAIGTPGFITNNLNDVQLLCAAAKAIWSFGPETPVAIPRPTVVTIPVKAGTLLPTDADYKCMTDANPASCTGTSSLPPPPGTPGAWGGFSTEPVLASPPNNLGSASAYYTACVA